MIKSAMLIAALVAATSADAAQERTRTMDITRKADLKTVEGPEDFFTGTVTITGQFQRPEPSRVGGAIVHFEPARVPPGTSIRRARP
jgi:hypothetical protein